MEKIHHTLYNCRHTSCLLKHFSKTWCLRREAMRAETCFLLMTLFVIHNCWGYASIVSSLGIWAQSMRHLHRKPPRIPGSGIARIQISDARRGSQLKDVGRGNLRNTTNHAKIQSTNRSERVNFTDMSERGKIWKRSIMASLSGLLFFDNHYSCAHVCLLSLNCRKTAVLLWALRLELFCFRLLSLFCPKLPGYSVETASGALCSELWSNFPEKWPAVYL